MHLDNVLVMKNFMGMDRVLFEYLKNDQSQRNELLKNIDVLVDGPFIHHLYKPNLPYKGSLNQRVIDVQKSLASGRVHEYII